MSYPPNFASFTITLAIPQDCKAYEEMEITYENW